MRTVCCFVMFIMTFNIIFLSFSNPILARERFHEKFDGDLSKWILQGEKSIKIIDSLDPGHGSVLTLIPNGNVVALIKDSDKWGGIRITGEVLFPDSGHNYLGLIYHYQNKGSRKDFGSIYVKGNGSYLQVNPHRDGNPSRLLYPEYKIPLTGPQKISQKKWYKFKAEILGSVCHFYFGDMSIPKLTFSQYEHAGGLMGFRPRVVGYPVWIDNIDVVSINQLGYEGPDIPSYDYDSMELITKWEYIGPLKRPINEIESVSHPSESTIDCDKKTYFWKPFPTDQRGAVITGKITEYLGTRPVAYFRTIIGSKTRKMVQLHFSSIDEIGLWVNGSFLGYIYRNGYGPRGSKDMHAWYDFWKDPNHEGRKALLLLRPGKNQILIRIRNGQYASGGFFLHIKER